MTCYNVIIVITVISTFFDYNLISNQTESYLNISKNHNFLIYHRKYDGNKIPVIVYRTIIKFSFRSLNRKYSEIKSSPWKLYPFELPERCLYDQTCTIFFSNNFLWVGGYTCEQWRDIRVPNAIMSSTPIVYIRL